MIDIQFPDHPYKIKEDKGKEFIFDDIRKQWLLLTPEEWVRQNFIQYLLQKKNYPASLMSIEKEIQLGELRKRCDVVIYKEAKPWMIVECKEMKVQLSDAVIKQILNYNIKLQVAYLVITNGKATYAVGLLNGKAEWLQHIPDFN